MKKIEKIRAREAARVCLVESQTLLKIAKEKLAEVDPGNLSLEQCFRLVSEHQDRILFLIVGDQADER